MRRIGFLSFILVLIPALVFAAPKANFVEGTDYQVLSDVPVAHNNKQVEVVEFFSFGCPWCYRLEPSIDQWVKTKPKNVEFKRVPAVFQPGWQIYAKAYYTAVALGVEDKIVPKLFAAVQDNGQKLSTEEDMAEFFVKHGVKKEDFESAFSFSPSIDLKMNQGDKLMREYKIFQIPTIVVDGKYYTNSQMAKGDSQRLLDTVDYLIKKETVKTK